jgi:hypothetical protein
VHAARQKVVHQVVLGGYRVENLSDFFRFLAFRNVFEAEVSGGFGIVAFALISHIAHQKRMRDILIPKACFVLARLKVRWATIGTF